VLTGDHDGCVGVVDVHAMTVEVFAPSSASSTRATCPLATPPPSPDRRENQGRDVVPSRVEDPKDATKERS
jgi:hypothetical protein